jgi:hypothetical protein
MTAFSRANRDKPLQHTIAYKGVPIFRGLALALDLADKHGADFSLFSADRRDAVLKRFNKAHGTNLHGQAYLVAMHARDPAKFAAANSPSTTSHCLRSDGNPTFRNARGRVIPAGGLLPWYELGIDGADAGKGNDPTHLLRVLHSLGFHVVQPYPPGREDHHFVFTSSPVPVLRARNVIPKG